MDKKVGNYLLKEQLFSNQQQVYYRAVKLQQDNGNERNYLCQQIPKKTKIPSIFQNLSQIYEVQSNNNIQFFDCKESDKNYYIIMEFLNQGTLDDIMSQQLLNENQAKLYLRDILKGLICLHKKQITFVDLSPKNIFYYNNELKIGTLNIYAHDIQNLNNDQDFNEYGVQKEIIPPEILQNQTNFSMISNLYSVGVLYFKMIFNRFPFQGKTKQELIENINQNNIDFSNKDLQISHDSIDFLKQTLKFSPNERLKWSQVYQHPLLKSLHVPNNQCVQSSLLNISMNQLITRADLIINTFDCEKINQFYSQIEQNPSDKVQEFQNQNKPFGGVGQLEQQLTNAKTLFKEQKINSLQKQLDYYIEQRNIYSSLSQTLSYVRVFDAQFQSIILEFILLKLIYLISQSLLQQLHEITNCFDQFLAQDLQQEYINFQNKIKLEQNIIDSQFKKALEYAKQNTEKFKKKGNKSQQEVEKIINDTSQFDLFKILNEQTQLFISAISRFENIQSDTKTQYEIIIQVLFSLALIVSYLLKWNPTQILEKTPIEYLKYYRNQNTEILIEECQKKKNLIQQGFEVISKQQ